MEINGAYPLHNKVRKESITMKIGLLEYGHEFKKQNLMTLSDCKGSYDLYVCIKCGLKGKRRGLSNELEIRKNSKKINCINKPKEGNIIVKALCANSTTSFVDTFYVNNKKTAKQEVESMINWFNSTLRPYETPRRLIKIEKIVEREDL